MPILDSSAFLFPLLLGSTLVILFLVVQRRRPKGGQSKTEPPLPPYGRVVWNGEEITYHRENGTIESLQRESIRAVRILTTPDGPFLPDVFWVFQTKEGDSMKIPSEAEGMAALTEELLELPGFVSHSFIEAMASTDYAIFAVWDRPVECF